MTEFKPDYLCDPPCAYHAALQEQLQIVQKMDFRISALREALTDILTTDDVNAMRTFAEIALSVDAERSRDRQ